jgi:hypothetical protein
MSEPVEPIASEPQPAPEAAPEPFDADRAMEKIRKANSEAENLRRRLKELEPKAAEYDSLVEASKSEMQRIQEAHTTAAKAAEDAQAEALRYRIALQHGISTDDLDLLGSGTEEQIQARAQRIASLHAQAKPADPPPARNAPALPGATPPPPPEVADVEARYRTYFPATN